MTLILFPTVIVVIVLMVVMVVVRRFGGDELDVGGERVGNDIVILLNMFLADPCSPYFRKCFQRPRI